MIKVNAIRGRLAELGKTQAWLAEKIGMSPNTMSDRMTCKSSFTLAEVNSICEALDIQSPREKQDIFLS